MVSLVYLRGRTFELPRDTMTIATDVEAQGAASHIFNMPRPSFSPQMLDLFGYIPPEPSAMSHHRTVKAQEPQLLELSDRALLAQLQGVVREVKQRTEAETDSFKRQELERGLLEAISTLQRLAPKRQRRRAASRAPAQPQLHHAKRKAVRAACAAGVAPGQLAKHFGLSFCTRAESRSHQLKERAPIRLAL